MLSLGALVLCWYGFFNRFPFLYSDTGAYMHAGFTGEVPRDRPIIYGLFMKHTSLEDTLWLTVFAQGLLVSMLIYLLVKYFSKKTNTVLVYFISVFFVSFLTPASQYICFLMPDIFSATLIMALGLFIFADSLTLRDKIFTIFMIILSIAMHNSNFMAAIAALMLLAFAKLITKKLIPANWKHLGIASVIVIAGIVAGSLTHYIYGRTFKLNQMPNVFFTARLVELGLVQDFLDNNCDDSTYALCQYKDAVGANFLWDPNSPLYKIGGWEVNNENFKPMINEILGTPEYLKVFIIRSIEDGFIQFFNFEMTPMGNCDMNSPPFISINHRYPFQIPQYIAARQSWGNLSLANTISPFHFLAFGVSLCGLLLFIFGRFNWSKFPASRGLIAFVIISLYTNALVCSALSIVDNRYQGRVAWIIPLVFVIVLFQLLPSLKTEAMSPDN